MLSEPAAGPEGQARRDYIQALLGHTLTMNWSKFVSVVLDYVLEIICQRSRVLPPKQHEHNLKELTKFLANRAERSHLYSLLNCVVPASESVINLIVYMLCMKLYEFTEVRFLHLLRSSNQVPTTSTQDFNLHKEEKETLYYCAGYIARCFLEKGRKKISARGIARKKCVEEQFLFVEGENYSEEFLQLKKWYDCVDRGGLVPVNEPFFNFIVDLEVIVRKSLTGNELKHEWVINELFQISNDHLLNYWYSVSSNYFGESESLLFLDNLVERYLNFSGKAEAGLRRRQYEGTSAVRDVALRTDLKRNR